MTIEEYLMYKPKQMDLTRSCNFKKRAGCSKVAYVRYQESYFDPLYHGRDEVLEYPESVKDEYYRLPHLKPCFQTPQQCTKFNSISHYSSEEVDIDNMNLEEYELYELAMSKRKSEVNNDNMTIEFCDQSPFTPNPPLDKKEFNLEEVLDDLLRTEAENLRRMKQEKVQNRCDDEKSGLKGPSSTLTGWFLQKNFITSPMINALEVLSSHTFVKFLKHIDLVLPWSSLDVERWITLVRVDHASLLADRFLGSTVVVGLFGK
ncbi:hypothetical protein Tco_0627797 [Tanacetum coccineum]|uniref:Uncharacterized protein n=1 Tax=Tanacetum coccineum TaxID=301880 RepID=A0ABQ4WNE9_9ASTR